MKLPESRLYSPSAVAAHMLATEFFLRAILVYFPVWDANIHFYVAFHRDIRE